MGRLVDLFSAWQPTLKEVAAVLHAPRFHRLRLERFPRGIDNVHIDVALDAEFVTIATQWVRNVLREDVYRHFWKQPPRTSDDQTAEVFRKAYADLTGEVVKQARVMARPERVQLFQLAVLKLLLSLVDRELRLLRDELDDAAAHPARRQSGQSLQVHERKVVLARYARSIRYRAASDAMRLVTRLEVSLLRKLRKTILGSSWPLSPDMFENPLLLLGGEGSSDDFLSHYPMLLLDPCRAHTACRAVMQVLQPWLPEGVGVPQSVPGESDVRLRRDQGGLNGYVEVEQRLSQLVDVAELQLGHPHAFDDATGVRSLLGGIDEGWPGTAPGVDPRFAGLQRTLVRQIGRALSRAGLKSEVRASYLMQQVYPMLGVRDASLPVYEYLCGRIRRRELAKRLMGLPGIEDGEALVRRVDEQVRSAQPRGAHVRQRTLVRCVSDCLQYRYHLKLAWWLFQGMDGLRLLVDDNEREMSQANGLLQLFSRDAGARQEERQVVGHVVIKADVRGSTEITAQMRARNLNPAAYFSRNLYDPINALLREYGAEKVFVEGDAVILAIPEYGQARQQHLAVARACGLAQRILEVVEAKNAESRRMELPQLELGLGIAYSDEAPTYLFDEGHKIMISPAINRADRLSSCNAHLRKLLAQRGGPQSGVDVVARQGDGEDGLDLLRFNVNGILMEAPAFYRLGVELKLRRIRLEGERGEFLVGRYPDIRGATHWLIVREAPVRMWIRNELLDESLEARSYHEVITDKDLRTRVQQRMVRRLVVDAPEG